MRKLSVSEFHSELKAQDVPREDLTLICPMCSTPQSARDLISAGAGKDFEGVEKYLGFSCVGRFTNAGPFKEGYGGNGCDWTLGGLFRLHELEVVDPDGKSHPRFEVATPSVAKIHAKRIDVNAIPGGGI